MNVDPQPWRRDPHSLVRKVVLTTTTGLLTFVVSEMLDGPLDVPLASQLVLSTLVGGITLLTQFLAEFDQRVRQLEEQQARSIAQARAVIDTEFARISDATRLFSGLEASALSSDALIELLRRAGQVGSTAGPELMLDLVRHEIERATYLLRCLAEEGEPFYDGEDREWLLALARNVRFSIAATSLSTVDARGCSFEGGLWTDDLGRRYLDLQRASRSRGVRTRRIFIFDGPGPDPRDVDRIYELHQAAGVEVRALASGAVPVELRNFIFDFVVFDGCLSYETIPASRIDPESKPGILTTRLVVDPRGVRERVERFDALWRVARPIDPDVQDPPSVTE